MLYYHQQRETIQNECMFYSWRREVTYVWKAGEKNAHGFSAKVVEMCIR